LLCQLEDLVSK